MKATWAYIHQPRNAGKYTPAEGHDQFGWGSSKRGKVILPDPDEFVDLLKRVQKTQEGSSLSICQRAGGTALECAAESGPSMPGRRQLARSEGQATRGNVSPPRNWK